MKARLIIPNVVAVVAGLLMAQAMRVPWWILTLLDSHSDNYLYPYVLRGPITEVLGYNRTAQMPLLTGILVGGIVLCFLGSLLRRNWGRLALGLAGIAVLLGVWRFYVRLADVASRFDMRVQGRGTVYYSGFDVAEVAARLGQGIYLMGAGAALCVVAALLHPWLRRPR